MSIAQKALNWALTKLGCAYSQSKRWNKNPDVFDCSSLVYRAFEAAGYTFKSGSTSNTEVNDTNFNLVWPSARSALGKSFTSVKALKAAGYAPKPGDIIYLCTNSGTTRQNKITHVAMVKDEKSIVHARGTAYGVREDSIDLYGTKVVAVTRWHEEPLDGAKASGEEVNAECSGSSVNLRKGPGTNYDVVTVLNKNHPLVTVTGAKDWAVVATVKDGKVVSGYMSAKYIDVIRKG